MVKSETKNGSGTMKTNRVTWGRMSSNAANSKCGEWLLEREPCEAGVYRLTRISTGAIEYFETAKAAKAHPNAVTCQECGRDLDDADIDAGLWTGQRGEAACGDCYAKSIG